MYTYTYTYIYIYIYTYICLLSNCFISCLSFGGLHHLLEGRARPHAEVHDVLALRILVVTVFAYVCISYAYDVLCLLYVMLMCFCCVLPRRVLGRGGAWLRTNGVNTNGAAAKAMDFDGLGNKVRSGTFGKIKVG